MAWFSDIYQIEKSSVRIAHFTDSHLFSELDGEYFNVNTAKNLKLVLESIKQQQVDIAIFGGDITQDHSLASYQLFVTLIEQADLACPVFWLPGNHDELAMYQTAFADNTANILGAKKIITQHYQILLINSKGETPAGWITQQHLAEIDAEVSKTAKPSMVFSHHHPLAIDGYLDIHILENGHDLVKTLSESAKVPILIHGHVHNDYQLRYDAIDIFATPATSIQFSKYTSDWQQQNLGPSYRLIEIDEQAQLNTQVIWVNKHD